MIVQFVRFTVIEIPVRAQTFRRDGLGVDFQAGSADELEQR